MKKQTGITLIALVITIIVLLILAGVSISAITGENGIVAKAKEAAEETEEAENAELSALENLEKEIEESVDDDEEEEKLELNEYGFYYNTFYVGTVYSDLFKMEFSGAIYFMDNNVCFWYNTTDGAQNLFYWSVENGILSVSTLNCAMAIKDGSILESGTNGSVEVDEEYKIAATKNEQGFYYDVTYFMKNKEIKENCLEAFISLDDDGKVYTDSISSSGTGSMGSASYDIEDYTFSNDGKTLTRVYNNQTEIYEIPEDIYDLQ